MNKKTRILKRSNSLKTATGHSLGFRNLNYDSFQPELNRFATRKTSRIFSAGLKKQSLFSRKFYRPDRFQRRLLRYDFKKSTLLASLNHNFDTIAFERPTSEPICRRRSSRRQVLFAFGLALKGSGAHKHRWTQESKISCKE